MRSYKEITLIVTISCEISFNHIGMQGQIAPSPNAEPHRI